MNYVVKESDLIGDIEDFPIEVVQKMVDNQYDKRHVCDVSVFQQSADAATYGFIWSETSEGWDFWNDVINKKQFYKFFDLYPIEDSTKLPKCSKLKESSKIYFTDSQRWVLSKIIIDNTAGTLRGIRRVLNENLWRTPYFEFPILQSELDEAYVVFDIDRDSECRDAVLHSYIVTTINSIYKMIAAHRGEMKDVELEIYGISWNRRRIVNWVKKNTRIVKQSLRIDFVSEHQRRRICFSRIISVVPPNFKWNDELKCYKDAGRNYLIGDIILRMN